MIKKLRTALTLGAASLLTGVGIVAATALPAQARTVSHTSVGTISGEYWVAGKNYDGGFRPVSGRCVAVQRKAAGSWRNNVSSTAPGGENCNSGTTLSWWIHDDTLAVNTDAIRLIVTDGSSVGSYKLLCSSKADCQQT